MRNRTAKITVLLALTTAFSLAILDPALASENEEVPANDVAEVEAEERAEFKPFGIGYAIGMGQFTKSGGPQYRITATWGQEDGRLWRLRGQYIDIWCFYNEEQCPTYYDLGLSYGVTTRSRYGHFSADAGLTVGRITDYHDRDFSPDFYTSEFTIGASGSVEAYFTPIPWVGIGVEVPVTINNRFGGIALLAGIKIGNLAPW